MTQAPDNEPVIELFTLPWHTTRAGATHKGAAVAYYDLVRVAVVVVGVGWDDAHPVRPWPRVTLGSGGPVRRTDAGKLLTISFLGLFCTAYLGPRRIS